MGLNDQIISLLKRDPGLTDREITDVLRGHTFDQQPINGACRGMEKQGKIIRRKRQDGLIGNFLSETNPTNESELTDKSPPINSDFLEDSVKATVKTWLEKDGWEVHVAWGHERGADIESRREGQRWIVEVKGRGRHEQMNANYFLSILGQIIQRMDDPAARYSIALPDIPQFRKLWERLPQLAKERTFLSAIFINADGQVSGHI
ncbi:MAG: hypothetical protein WEA61_06790 [Anaerolineales bacterium]